MVAHHLPQPQITSDPYTRTTPVLAGILIVQSDVLITKTGLAMPATVYAAETDPAPLNPNTKMKPALLHN